MKTAKITTTLGVLLFIPNLIGYARLILVIFSFYYAFISYKVSIVCYTLAFVGDVVDGYAARALNQCSVFGGYLDMITDRVSTLGLLIILSNLYPRYIFEFIMLIILDISSHWIHVMSVTVNQSHKSTEALQHRNQILRWYYSIYPLFGYCCVGTECFYILLYINHHYHSGVLENICFYFCFPACILKQVVNVIQLSSATYAIAGEDAKKLN
mmetsp:Transcript_28332/g.27154  ORF Transcript_28332/g.27154 Transcript_28332/m.27154 type:complete len:212 (-) Transcript_28332:263-898(-)